jgi:ABC-type transporter Mla subunit MlaD
LLIPLLLGALILAGCGAPAQKPAAPPAKEPPIKEEITNQLNQVQQEMQRAVKNFADKTAEITREEVNARMESLKAEFEQQRQVLEKQAATAGEDVKARINDALKDLDAHEDELAKKWDQLKQGTGTAAAGLLREVSEAMKALNNALERSREAAGAATKPAPQPQ